MLTAIRTTKEKLLRAALSLVARDGFSAATTAAIAEAAGVAEGTLYRHFPSKDDLLIEAYRRLKSEVYAAIVDGDDPEAPPEVRAKRIWRSLFDAYRADVEAFMFGQRFGESELARREGGAAYESIKTIVGGVWRDGVEQGLFKDLPSDLMGNLFFAPVGYMLKTEVSGRRWSEADLDAAAEAVLDAWRR